MEFGTKIELYPCHQNCQGEGRDCPEEMLLDETAENDPYHCI